MGITYEVLTYINVYICKVAKPPSHPLTFSCNPGMSKLLKSRAVSLPEIKNQQGRKFDETCRLRICNLNKAKTRKINKKGGDKQKKQDSYSTMRNKTHFRFYLIVIFKMLY